MRSYSATTKVTQSSSSLRNKIDKLEQSSYIHSHKNLKQNLLLQTESPP